MPAGKLVVITGIKELDKRLKTLEPRVQKKVLRQAMRAGLKILAAEVKAQVPVDTGATKSQVKVRAVKRRKRGTIELEVQIVATDQLKRTSSKTGQTVFYPAIVEYGSPGRPANPFMHRAYAAAGESARQETMVRLRAGIEREAQAK